MHDVAERAAIRDAAFNAFGHELVGVAGILEIAVFRAHFHRAQAAHAAIALVAAALEEFGFARGFLGAGEQAADHYRRRAGDDGLADVARVADAAVGDQRNTILQRFGDHRHRGDLRHAHTRDDARGADRTRTDPDLHRVRTRVFQRQRGVAGDDVAADHLQQRKGFFRPAHAVDHALRMAVRGVDDNHVNARGHQGFDALFGVAAHTHRGTHQQTFAVVVRGVGVVTLLLDVLHRDQAAQLKGIVDHQYLFDPVLVQQRQHFFIAGVFAHGNQAILLGHDVMDRIVELGLEAHVAAGDDADQATAVDDRHAGDVARPRQLEHFADGGVGADGERFLDDPGFELLHLRDLRGLLFQGQVLVDDADAAELRHRDGEAGLGHGVHCSSNDRQVQAQRACEPGGERNVLGQDNRVRGNERDIVVRERFSLDAEHGRSGGNEARHSTAFYSFSRRQKVARSAG